MFQPVDQSTVVAENKMMQGMQSADADRRLDSAHSPHT
jgi:hypothetical protein